MGFRFRKSFRLLPGVRVNLSKSGTSFSLGKPGATLNVGGKRSRATVGLPGTGVSFTQNLTSAAPRQRRSAEAPVDASVMGILGSLFSIAGSLIQIAIFIGVLLLMGWLFLAGVGF